MIQAGLFAGTITTAKLKDSEAFTRTVFLYSFRTHFLGTVFVFGSFMFFCSLKFLVTLTGIYRYLQYFLYIFKHPA